MSMITPFAGSQTAQPFDFRQALAMQVLGIQQDPFSDALSNTLDATSVEKRVGAAQKLKELKDNGTDQETYDWCITGKYKK